MISVEEKDEIEMRNAEEDDSDDIA